MEITGIYLLAFIAPMLISLAQRQDPETQRQLHQAEASPVVRYLIRNRLPNGADRRR
jgi:hypothetical protein